MALLYGDILGHENIKEHLINAVRSGKNSHAYLFCGEDDSGKMMLAKAFAASLLCDSQTGVPCGNCKNCKEALSGNHPDIIIPTHEKKGISVGDIRDQVNNTVIIKPYNGGKKIYIIDEAEKMNDQAQNALLKTIEEPPEYAVFLLLTNNRTAMLPTILSRCLELSLLPVADELIVKLLMEKYSIPDYSAELVAAFSGGIAGKAVKAATSQRFAEQRDDVISMLSPGASVSTQKIIESVKVLNDNKGDIAAYLELIRMWFRDVMVYKSTNNKKRIMYRTELAAIERAANAYPYEKINSILAGIDEAEARLKANVNFELSMELMLRGMII